MKYLFKLFLLLSIHFFSISGYAQFGKITGKIIDAKTNESLAGVNLLVNEIDNLGASSDTEGYFEIPIRVGSYSVKASLIGYTSVVKTDVIVKTKNNPYLVIHLSPSTFELGEVKVQADYFDKSVIENNMSAVILSPEEVKRSPGSMSDFQRILQAMAGVSFSNDQTNELLVRGGSPNENLTVFDNIELHSTNHYPNELNSGGPINMINTDLIQDIEFTIGGFNSKYGDKLSSVTRISTREGTRNRTLAANLSLGMAGVGAVLEGGINRGKGSWIISARKSYIDLIAGAVGLTAVPRYYDAQFKLTYDLTQAHNLSWVGIYGNDRIDIEGEADKTKPEKANVTDSVDIGNINVKQDQWASGITLRSFWSKNLFSNLTVSANNYHSDVAVTQDFTSRRYDGDGKVTDTKKLNSRDVFDIMGDNTALALKADLSWNQSRNNEINFGGQITFGRYNSTSHIDADTVRYDTDRDGEFDQIVIKPESELNYNLKLFDNHKHYLYINDKAKFFNDRFILNLGLRYDCFTYSQKSYVSPRISASYYLIPLITSINAAYGDYYQTQSYPTYGDRYQSDINRYLENTHARHYLIGIEHIIADGLKINLEAYYKQYEKIPVKKEFINFDNKTFRSEESINIGKQDIYGLDLLIQQKLVNEIYGTLSFSRMWTEVDDPRIGREGNSYPSDFDFPYVLTIIFGKRFKDLRKEIGKLPGIIKYPLSILPISDDMEMSVRWRYASGRVYTPQYYTDYVQHREGGVRWSQGSWLLSDDINSARYPDYHRLDFSMYSRFNFGSWNLVVALSIQNLYNRKNIAMYRYNSDGTIDNVNQFAILPVGEIEIEF